MKYISSLYALIHASSVFLDTFGQPVRAPLHPASNTNIGGIGEEDKACIFEKDADQCRNYCLILISGSFGFQ